MELCKCKNMHRERNDQPADFFLNFTTILFASRGSRLFDSRLKNIATIGSLALVPSEQNDKWGKDVHHWIEEEVGHIDSLYDVCASRRPWARTMLGKHNFAVSFHL
jgi:hypothetical protein